MITWDALFEEIKQKDYFESLNNFLDKEYSTKTIFPERSKIFHAFELTSCENLKMVIIGQDPYHEPGQAQGLAFSVPDGVKVPPSLINIFKEAQNDMRSNIDFKNGNLEYLAKQGVLLINAYLTVEAGKPLSHHRKEYDSLLKDIISFIDKLNQPIVFMLWGNFAKKYVKLLSNPQHLVIEAAHPSPLSANQGGWFNQHIFSRANSYLKQNHISPIDWSNKRD